MCSPKIQKQTNQPVFTHLFEVSNKKKDRCLSTITSSLTFDNSDGLADPREYYISQFPVLLSISCLLTRSACSDANPTPSGCGGLRSSFSSWEFKSPLAVTSWDLQSSAGILGGSSPSAVISWEQFNATRDPCLGQQHDKTRNTAT